MADEQRGRRRRRRGGRGRGKPGAEAASADSTPKATPKEDAARRDPPGEPARGGRRGKQSPPGTILGLPRFLFVLVLSVFVSFLILQIITLVTGGGDNDDDVLATVQTFPDQGRRHLDPGETFNGYNSTPPTSGPQDATGIDPGIYDTSQRFEAVLPLLERGGVALYYHPDRLDPSEVEDITKASESAIRAGRRLALIPHQGITDDALVVSAWRHQLRIQEFMQATTMEQIGDFVTFFDGLYELETRR